MLNNTGVMDYFKQEFGFSPLEVGTQWSCIVTKSACPVQATAIMGGHTLGGANIFNSGWHGAWVTGQEV